MFPFCNLFKVHYNTCQGYVRLASSMQNHDHSVEGDLANANSAQTVLYFFLLMLYKTSTCKIFWLFQIIYWRTIRNFDYKNNKNKIKIGNYIGRVMVSVFASSATDCGYELRSCQSSIQNHDHSVEGDMANANSAQTALYFFLLMLYKTSTCKTCAVVLF
jgi:hypothetical protein